MTEQVSSDEYCTRCGELLAPANIQWLELSLKTARYSRDDGSIPRAESQGLHPFGRGCAKAVLDNDGENVGIRGGK